MKEIKNQMMHLLEKLQDDMVTYEDFNSKLLIQNIMDRIKTVKSVLKQ